MAIGTPLFTGAYNSTADGTVSGTLPATVNAGDLILLFYGVQGTTPTMTWPAGYTDVSQSGASSTNKFQGTAYKVAAGTEGGGTVNVSSTATTKKSTLIMVVWPGVTITGYAAGGSFVGSSTTTVSCPSVTVGGNHYGVLAVAMQDGTHAPTWSGLPAGFTKGIQEDCTATSSVNGIAMYQTDSGTEASTGTLSVTSNISNVYTSTTFVFAPASSGGGSASTSDSFSLSESLARTQATQVRTSADSVTVSDSLARSAAESRTATDSIVVSDAITARSQALQSRALADSIVVSDALTDSHASGRNTADSIVISDALARSQGTKSRALGDSAAVSDALGRTQSTQVRGSNDSVVVSDSVSGHATPTRRTADSFSLSDNLTDSFQRGGHTFTPPTIPYPINEDDVLHLGRYMRPKGVSVLKINGVYITVEYPTDAQILASTEHYLGGHGYAITTAQAVALVNAGYQVDTPESIGSTGSPLLAPPGYFSQGGDPGAPYFNGFPTPNPIQQGTPDSDNDTSTPSYLDV
jgi:hypothetical protein